MMEMEVNNGGGHEYDDDDDDDDDDDEMANAEEFDTAATIECAKKDIRPILHGMENSLQIAKKVEQSTMIQAFNNLYPEVTSQEFYEKGDHQREFHLVRDARCFFLVMQWNKGENGNFKRKVSCTICSMLSLLFVPYIQISFLYRCFHLLYSHAYFKLE